MITVIGLGVRADDLSLRAWNRLKNASCIWIRNECPASEALRERGIFYRTLDFVYEKSRNFDTLAKNLLSEVKKSALLGDVCYCFEGGISEDRIAQLLLGEGAEGIDGLSKAEYYAAQAGICGAFFAVSAFELREKRIAFPLVCYDLADRALASDVKLSLSEKISEESDVLYFDGERESKIKLYELDRQTNFSPRGALVVYETPLLEKKRFEFDDAVEILRRLRAPDGCPWDRVQTHESIRVNAIEEAYELVDAIDAQDSEKICEESGDVLMQALFHALIEEEKGNFSVGDMIKGLCDKLISRHTHVFGKDRTDNADGALSVWEKNKMIEKKQTTYSDSVNDVPQCFPALLRAQKLCKRVEKGGWDKATLEIVESKLKEEFSELKTAVRSGESDRIFEELGDFLLSAAWLCRAVGADGETALLEAGKKLQRRYTVYESLVRADGKDPLALSREERDAYYRRAKDGR